MRRVTALSAQRGRRGRVNVFLDGEFAFGAAAETVLRAGLKVGSELDEAAIARLQDDDASVRIYNDALRFLSFRPRSVAEVERYLRGRDADEALVAATVERLQRSGLLDDDAFARYWIDNRTQFNPRGARALHAELRAKGVDNAQIESAIEESGAGDEDQAYQAGLKRLRALERLDEQTFRQRMYGFLLRRGFDYEQARAATERLWTERGAEGDA